MGNHDSGYDRPGCIPTWSHIKVDGDLLSLLKAVILVLDGIGILLGHHLTLLHLPGGGRALYRGHRSIHVYVCINKDERQPSLTSSLFVCLLLL